MPAGKHTGVRTNVTLPPEVDAVYVKAAQGLNMPKASLIRQVLEQAAPQIAEAPAALQELMSGSDPDEVAARLLWQALKHSVKQVDGD